jgi:hypothetical protein
MGLIKEGQKENPMRYTVFAVLVLLLIAGACAEVSQEDAGKKCEAYLLQSETTSISGPVVCGGVYWICDFDNYGKRQAVLMAVDKYSGAVLDRVDDATQLESVVRTKYLVDIGGSSVLQMPVLEENFIIQVMSLNTTFANRKLVLEGLKENAAIKPSQYLNLTGQLNVLQGMARDIVFALIDARNTSSAILLEQDCSLRDEYMEEVSMVGPLIGNFTQKWQAFVIDYNNMVDTINAVVTKIGSTNIELFSSTVGDIDSTVSAYLLQEDDYTDKVMGNIGTRQRRLDSKELLDDALKAVENSNNDDAVDKYNDAIEAFNEGAYLKADRLSREAISLAKQAGDNDVNDVISISPIDNTDYTLYFTIIAVLLGAMVLVLYITRRGKKDSDDYGDEKGDDVSHDWSWEGGKKSSLEKAAD